MVPENRERQRPDRRISQNLHPRAESHEMREHSTFEKAGASEARSGGQGAKVGNPAALNSTTDYQKRMVWKYGKSPNLLSRVVNTLWSNLLQRNITETIDPDKSGTSPGIRFGRTIFADVKKRYGGGISLAFGQRLRPS